MKVHSLGHSWIIQLIQTNRGTVVFPYLITHMINDSEKQLGIDIDDVYIPFGTSSSMVYFDTVYRTMKSLKRCLVLY